MGSIYGKFYKSRNTNPCFPKPDTNMVLFLYKQKVHGTVPSSSP